MHIPSSPITVTVNIDGVDVRFEATVITDTFPGELVLANRSYDATILTNRNQQAKRESMSARR